MTPNRKILLGGLFAVLSSALFTGKVIIAKLAYARGIDPLGLVALRMMFASPFFMVMLYRRRENLYGLSWRQLAAMVVLGLVGYYLASILDFFGILYISTALERMILQLSPSMVLIIGVVFMGQKFDRRLMYSILIGYIGVGLMVCSEMIEGGSTESVHTSWLGVVLIFAATVSFALYVIGAEKFMRTVESRAFTALMMLGACGGVLIHYMVMKGFVVPTHDLGEFGYGAMMGIFCTVVPSFMINRAIQLIGGSRIGPYNYFGMGLTFVVSSMLLDESFSPLKLLGIFLAAAGALALTSFSRKTKEAAA